MLKPGQWLAIYDLDQTITHRDTRPDLVNYVWGQGQSSWRFVLQPLLLPPTLLFLAGLLTRKQLKRIVLMHMLGRVMPEGLCHGFARHTLATNVREDALAQIAQDRADGAFLLLATASQRFWAEPIGKALGFDAVIASENKRRLDGSLSSRLAGENCYGEEKWQRIKSWLKAQGISRNTRMRFYSDHVSDAATMARVAEPVAVTPHKPLRELAMNKGWRIEDWG
jgi:HAD superfamily phosphoserine phosphatase-like hydrolase